MSNTDIYILKPLLDDESKEVPREKITVATSKRLKKLTLVFCIFSAISGSIVIFLVSDLGRVGNGKKGFYNESSFAVISSRQNCNPLVDTCRTTGQVCCKSIAGGSNTACRLRSSCAVVRNGDTCSTPRIDLCADSKRRCCVSKLATNLLRFSCELQTNCNRLPADCLLSTTTINGNCANGFTTRTISTVIVTQTTVGGKCAISSPTSRITSTVAASCNMIDCVIATRTENGNCRTGSSTRTVYSTISATATNGGTCAISAPTSTITSFPEPSCSASNCILTTSTENGNCLSGSRTVTVVTSIATPASNGGNCELTAPTSTVISSADSTCGTSNTDGVTIPGRIVSPHVDITLWPPIDFQRWRVTSGVQDVTFSFVTADTSNTAKWAGFSLAADQFHNQVNDIKNNGGTVTISFGGAIGKELAVAITDVQELVKQYRSVIDQYQIRRIDMDIEGSALDDVSANIRRAQALKILQDAIPDLIVTFTVAVTPTGLTQQVLDMLEHLRLNQVRVSILNIMAMDYGTFFGQTPDMGKVAIAAASGTLQQLAENGFTCDLGIIAMIGNNDIEGEVFTQEDARRVVEFARATPKVRSLSFWSLHRDTSDMSLPLFLSSKITQFYFEFSVIFNAFRKP